MVDPRNFNQWQIPVRSTVKQAGYLVNLAQLKEFPAYTHFVSGWDDLSFTANSISHSGLWYREFNYRDRASPSWSLKEVSAGTVGLSTAELSQDCLYILADNSSIKLSPFFPSFTDLATGVCLGVIIISSGAIAQAQKILIENNPFNNSQLLLYHGGIVNRGLRLSPKSGTRSFSIPTGELEVVGSNYFIDSADPHKYTVPFQDVVSYDLCAPDGTVITADATELDFSQIWDGTALQSVTGNNASVVHFYYCPYRSGNKVVGIIGAIDYSSITVARRDWRDLEEHIAPDWLVLPNKLIAVAVGRTDYDFADNKARVSFNPQIDFRGSALSGGTPTQSSSIAQSCFQYYNESDRSVGTGVTKWQINSTVAINDGFAIANNTDFSFPSVGRYQIAVSGGQDNASAYNAQLWTAINFNGVNIAATTFSTIEIDGVGSKSGSAIATTALIEVTDIATDTLYIYSSGNQPSVLRNVNISIVKI